jgi:uncharacterized protein (TIRG00374 family)
MGKPKKILMVFLRIISSVVLLVLVFKCNKITMPSLLDTIKDTDKLFLVSGFVVFFFSYFFSFLRWQMLLKTAGMVIPLKKLISSFSGGVFGFFLPTSIGEDLVRTTDLARHTSKVKKIIATVLLDRISGYIGLVIVIIPATFFSKNLVTDKTVFTSLAIIVVALVLILLFLFNNPVYLMISKLFSASGAGKIREAVKDTHQEIHAFWHRKKVIISNLILSFIIQIIPPVSAYFIALSLGININLIYFFILISIIVAISAIPISMGGLGLRENLFVIYFAKVGVVKESAMAMSLLIFSFMVIYGAIGGLIYVFTVRYRSL